jgi:23S rRNA (cytosine1962-C5)-methyltransferase
MYPTLKLKTGKEAAVTYGHPWIFSGAFEALPEAVTHGTFVHVADRKGEIIATGSFSRRGSIAVRVFALGKVIIDRAFIEAKIRAAAERRSLMNFGEQAGHTTGYRVVFGESDGLPGLVVDRFGDTAVFQIATASLDGMREEIIAAIDAALNVPNIVERSDMSGRREEGLEAVTGVRKGSVTAPVPFKEFGMPFESDVLEGQKTGYFCDQKYLRVHIGNMAKGAKILNLFSYTGAAGVYAMKGGAERVHNVDESAHALLGVKRNAELNGIDPEAFTTEEADIFQWLANASGEYDMVIIDPPAIIKSQKDIESGAKAYHFLNRAAMKLVKDGGIFVTSSCSHFMTEDDLMYTLRRASVQAGVRLETLAVLHQSPDHPVSVYFPESAY